ncbi:MAG TPA: 30S ribosomal protein S6 [Alphaproteobacteria bacterium]|nr:30S ribosomal protein S6 [Alphaproteobacteria bacterium]
MASYELTYIIRPDVPTTQVDTVLGKITDVIKKARGKVAKTEQWGLRTLAYPIRKHKRGYYTHLGITLPGEGVAEVEHQLKLAEDVIRFVTVKVDEISKEPSAVMKAKARDAAQAEEFNA